MNYIFLDNGFEEIEAITTIDLLRRANIALTTVSVTGQEWVMGAHNIPVKADALIANLDFADAEMLILPGGATKLHECEALCQLLVEHNEQEKLIAAICAAPMVYGHLGILDGVKATCYPGVQGQLKGAEYTAEIVTKDGQFITGRGPAAAMEFGYAIAEHFLGQEAVAPLREGMIYNQLLA